jgi:hypothetical protein
MATLETRLITLASAIGADVKALRLADGDLTSLTTNTKATLVAAINELHAALATAGVVINDTAGNGDTTVVWSADKVYDEIALAISTLRTDLTGGASAALDTFAELAAAISNDSSFAATIATSLGNRVRFDDVQVLNLAQQQQACANIGIGDPNADILASYLIAKA